MLPSYTHFSMPCPLWNVGLHRARSSITNYACVGLLSAYPHHAHQQMGWGDGHLVTCLRSTYIRLHHQLITCSYGSNCTCAGI